MESIKSDIKKVWTVESYFKKQSKTIIPNALLAVCATKEKAAQLKEYMESEREDINFIKITEHSIIPESCIFETFKTKG